MSFCPWNWKHIIPRTLYILPPSEVKETSTKSFRMSKETTLIVACGARTSTHELMWPPTRGKRSFDYKISNIKQNSLRASRLFVHFTFPSLPEHEVKLPGFTFMEGVNTRQLFF